MEGVPQGSVLSVALFAIMINDVDASLPPSIGRSLFVDDFAIWCSSHTTLSVERQLQLAVNKIEAWGTKNGFRFSTSKTAGIHFCRRRGACPDMQVNLYGSAVSFQRTVRFLGVTLDSRLTYADHISLLRTTSLKALNVLKTVSRMRYGADRWCLLLLYRSLVRSRLDYACVVYDLASESVKGRLNAVHHAGVRIATGAFRTTPIPSLLVEADEAPLTLRRQELGMRYSCKILQFTENPAYSAIYRNHAERLQCSTGRPLQFCSRNKAVLRECGVSDSDVIPVVYNVESPWELVTPEVDTTLAALSKSRTLPSALQSEALGRIETYDGYTAVYTDGSKLSSGVGSAFVSGGTCRSRSLPPSASIYTAELYAIILALHFIRSSSQSLFLLLIDSLSAIQSLESFNIHPFIQLIYSLHHQIHQQGKRVVFCWIPAHVGIVGNERADRAAKRAAARTFYAHYFNFPIPFSDFLPIIHRFINQRWQRAWDECGPQKLKAVKPEIGHWTCGYRRKRYEEVALCRLRVGHTHATHRHLLLGQQQPMCGTCNAPLSVRHVLVECPNYEVSRRRYFGVNPSIAEMISHNVGAIQDGRLFEFIRVSNLNIIYSPHRF